MNLLAAELGVRGAALDRHARSSPAAICRDGSFAVFLRTVERRYPWLPPRLHLRYAHAYGTRLERVLGDAASLADLGDRDPPWSLRARSRYLCREEFAQTADDILWRRTKLGLHLLGRDLRPLATWLAAQPATAPLAAAAG